MDLLTAIKNVLASPNVASRRPIFESYDKDVQGNTAWERGDSVCSMSSCFRDFEELNDEDSKITVAVTGAGNPSLAKISAQYAAEHAVSASVLNLACVGATPIGATDCLNFGNPEKPEQMGQLVEGIDGVKAACEGLNVPIVSGNVSLYNESSGRSIPPSAIISIFGKVKDPETIKPIGFIKPGETIFILGSRSQNLGGSEFLKVNKQKDSRVSDINFDDVLIMAEKLKSAVSSNLISSVNNIGVGGLIAATTESSFIGNIGLELNIPEGTDVPHFLFNEDLGAIFTSSDVDAVQAHFGNMVQAIGTTQVPFKLNITQANEGLISTDLEALKDDWNQTLRNIF